MRIFTMIAALLYAATLASVLAAPPGARAPDDVRPIHELVGQAEVWTMEEIHRVAKWRDAPEYWIVEEPVYFITEGLVPYDHRSGEGTRTGKIDRGVWLNTSEHPVVVAGGEMEPFELLPGAMVAVGPSVDWEQADQDAAGEGNCDVTCRDGFYACCNYSGCRCRSSSSQRDDSMCNAGGRGAAECEHPVREEPGASMPKSLGG